MTALLTPQEIGSILSRPRTPELLSELRLRFEKTLLHLTHRSIEPLAPQLGSLYAALEGLHAKSLLTLSDTVTATLAENLLARAKTYFRNHPERRTNSFLRYGGSLRLTPLPAITYLATVNALSDSSLAFLVETHSHPSAVSALLALPESSCGPRTLEALLKINLAGTLSQISPERWPTLRAVSLRTVSSEIILHELNHQLILHSFSNHPSLSFDLPRRLVELLSLKMPSEWPQIWILCVRSPNLKTFVSELPSDILARLFTTKAVANIMATASHAVKSETLRYLSYARTSFPDAGLKP